jgi:hypothetical protein
MQLSLAKRILGGIAWAIALGSSPVSLGQDGPALSSKDYLRLMEQANERRQATIAVDSDRSSAVTHASSLPVNAPTTPLPPVAVPPVAVQPVIVQPPPMQPPPMQPVGVLDRRDEAFVPRISFSMEPVWYRRVGDEGTRWSSGGLPRAFGEERASQVRIGWYSNPMDRYEFAFLGSLEWNRYEQTHSSRFRSYECNKRWITDDLGNTFFGLHVIDYRENYRLPSVDGYGSGTLDLETGNLLLGLQGGMELWHPISQRLALGGQGVLGLYGNDADGSWSVDLNDGSALRRADGKFPLAASFGFDAKCRYQFTSRLQAFGSYRWWYLAGMATVDDQTIGPLVPDTPFALSTDEGFLLQGATCGLEIVF